jgi:hypothetical protein
MKIREICHRRRRTEIRFGPLTDLDIEALSAWLVENLFHEFGKQLVIASPSVADEFELADELERRRKQRRRQRSHAAGPGGIGSPPQNDGAVAPAADALVGDAAAGVAMGGPTLR